ncbi:hypothetical protein NP493_435g02043 [Ridgeia piscesae]|uniref:Centriolar and ciliogenesis-associated protein HYLS1 C-terminal domain-containing protein n=1 Tax=Ridgeia piscesae TaxID=27915 RepID=A0AAD9NTZ6_RIDPI|nr:hypothetical protein NP493_435g02043 [Ridgeia piscesae]
MSLVILTFQFGHRQYGKENTLSRGLCGLPYYATDMSHPGMTSRPDTASHCQSSAAEPCHSKTTGPVYISRPVIGRDISDSLLQRANVSLCSSHQGACDDVGGGVREQQTVTDTSLNTTTSSERRMIKRKVLRRRDGHTQVFDEMTESEIGDTDISSLQERLSNLPISVVISKKRPQSAPARRTETGQRRPLSAREDPCYRLPADFDGPKALIRPMTAEPHWRNIKKCDPVTRGELYRKSWQTHRAPGEKNHNGLRWSMREHMLQHDVVVEKQPGKSYVRNSYVIPSDKKRKTLRWQIRQKLAEGAVPSAALH